MTPAEQTCGWFNVSWVPCEFSSIIPEEFLNEYVQVIQLKYGIYKCYPGMKYGIIHIKYSSIKISDGKLLNKLKENGLNTKVMVPGGKTT